MIDVSANVESKFKKYFPALRNVRLNMLFYPVTKKFLYDYK